MRFQGIFDATRRFHEIVEGVVLDAPDRDLVLNLPQSITPNPTRRF